MKVEDPLVVNIFTAGGNVEQSTTGVNGQFVHSLLLIDVLLRMESVETEKQDFIAFCKNEYKGNKIQLDILCEFKVSYTSKTALWWYTRESFLYKMVNKALRVQNIDVLFLFRFFLRDIHHELQRNQCQSAIRTYRGQVLSNDELTNLRKSVGELISISSFFSTTLDRDQAIMYLDNCNISDDLHRVLFEIDADPAMVKTKPFADIHLLSQFGNELEVLFMVGSIFRLGTIQRNTDRIWIISLTLCGDDEYDLKDTFESMKKKCGGNKATTLLTFGRVLRRMGKLDLAEKYYHRLLSELPSTHLLFSDLCYSFGLVLTDKGDLNTGLQYLQKSLELKLETSPNDHEAISDRYNAIGTVHQRKCEHDSALSCYKKGIKLLEQGNTIDNLKMAHFYNNIAVIYDDQKKYQKALDFSEKALTIREQHLPPNDSDIGLSYNNVGNIHRSLGNYDSALKHLKRSLEIRLKALPPDHPDIAQSYGNIGFVHEKKGELQQALTFYQQARTIHRKSLPAANPFVIEVEEDIKRVSI